jgi:hypothetical protein
LSQKRHFFAEFFSESIKKIITSVPGLPDGVLSCGKSQFL